MSSLHQALNDAAERERRFLWGLSYRLTGSTADADEVVQEAFVRALEAKPSTDAALRPWLSKVTVHLSLDRLRRRHETPQAGTWLPGLIDTPEAAFDAAPSTEAEFSLKESVTLAFLLALEVLAPPQRAALVLRDVFGLSAKETASCLDTTEAHVRQLHHRARTALEPYEGERCEPDPALRARSRELLERLLQALLSNDVKAAAALLRVDVKALSDGGGKYSAARVPVLGVERVFLFYRRLMELRPALSVDFKLCNGLWVVDGTYEVAHANEAPRGVTGLVPTTSGAALVYSQLADARLPHAWPGW